MRGRSYTPSPPRGYGRRGRSPSPRGRNGGRGRGDAPTSLLVRNLRHDCRPECLKRQFGQFGPVKDVYLPRDYYTGQPRGFGFVQYVDPADALEAKHQMDGEILQGRELTVVFAEENRKKPTEMRSRERGGRSRTSDRRRSPPRYSRSPPPQYGRGRSHSQDYYLSPKTRYSRPVSLCEKKYSRERSNSLEHSRPYNGSQSSSRSPVRERSPYGLRSCSQSPSRGHSRVRAQRSPVPILRRSRSPYPADYSRKPGGDGSPSQ